MKGRRFKEDQIIRFLKEAESGISIKDLCRQYGFSEQTFYRWRSKYGGMDTNQLKYLKRLEAENRELKQMIAEISLENRAIKAVLEKNF
jgi:putative transposase